MQRARAAWEQECACVGVPVRLAGGLCRKWYAESHCWLKKAVRVSKPRSAVTRGSSWLPQPFLSRGNRATRIGSKACSGLWMVEEGRAQGWSTLCPQRTLYFQPPLGTGSPQSWGLADSAEMAWGHSRGDRRKPGKSCGQQSSPAETGDGAD